MPASPARFQTATLPPDSTVLEAVTAARIAIDRDLGAAQSHAMHFISQAGIAELVHRPLRHAAPRLRAARSNSPAPSPASRWRCCWTSRPPA